MRISDRLLEVDAWTGFADCFTHQRSGRPAEDRTALLAAVLADGINLGLTGSAAPVTATPLGARRGLAAVECARGRLYHLVTLDAAGRIARLDMLAPTEWSFHADAPLARALIGRTPAAEPTSWRRIGWLLSAFDPCVAHRLEIVEAADA